MAVDNDQVCFGKSDVHDQVCFDEVDDNDQVRFGKAVDNDQVRFGLKESSRSARNRLERITARGDRGAIHQTSHRFGSR